MILALGVFLGIATVGIATLLWGYPAWLSWWENNPSDTDDKRLLSSSRKRNAG